MDERLLEQLQRHVRDQCGYAMIAAKDASVAGNALDSVGLWYNVQNLLIAAANVSKALWGKGEKRRQERQPLRDSLGVTDDSVLANRDLRNHFEHFDERLQTWYEESERHNFFDSNIGLRPGAVVTEGFELQTDVEEFRSVDPDTGVVSFGGADYDVRGITTAATEVFERACEVLGDDQPPPPSDNTAGDGQ